MSRSSLGSSPGRGHRVAFASKKGGGGGRTTPSHFMLQKPDISVDLMGHLARMQTPPLP